MQSRDLFTPKVAEFLSIVDGDTQEVLLNQRVDNQWVATVNDIKDSEEDK